MTPSFNTVIKDLPVMYTEDNVRHLYRSFWISKEIEVFVLDTRNGYLGKEQARWLKDSLRKSSALYKLIFTGKSFGINFVSEFTDQTYDESSLGENGGNNNNNNNNGITDNININGLVIDNNQDNNNDNDNSNNNNNGNNNDVNVNGNGNNDEEVDINDENLVNEQGEDGKKVDGNGTSGINDKKPSRKVSTSRQKALEATQEEYDEDGLPKTSLQHAIVHTFHKNYPEGYPQQENQGDENNDENEQNGNDYGDDNSSYNSPITKEKKEFTTEEDVFHLSPHEDGEQKELEGDEISEISQCINSISLYLYGKIIIFSSTNASDSFVATYAFNDNEPQVPNELSSFIQLASYCLEIGIGMGPSGFDGEKCTHRPHKNQAIENMITKGQRLLFRSLGPYEQEQDQEHQDHQDQQQNDYQQQQVQIQGDNKNKQQQVPLLSLKKETKESDKCLTLYNQLAGNTLKPLVEVLNHP
eukprot:CAMPEP_0174820164 /NCGR_PEP_ID=MMETSP1107-20130205/3824_1 /TAXON_ID=36770 /ORGANISM="Paraphysomonas vestita, Strain GFlagA" /LENGTH=470 /DNA_ID=CAMNT_0016034975 /DNA_START=826 /DNA_END=2235 /DNA_ORIENTATION=+